MAKSYHHAVSSARKWGGVAEDYQAVHDFFDESKMILGDLRHRALRHHAEGIWLAQRVFGVTMTNSIGRAVPVRLIGEQHLLEDFGFIPSFADWARAIRPAPWMGGPRRASGAETAQAASAGCEKPLDLPLPAAQDQGRGAA